MGKADRVKKSTRKGKRMFQGNQFTRMNTNSDLTPPSSQQQTPIKTVSSTKVQTFETDTPGKKDKFIDGYRFVDMEILSIVISVLSCPVCQLCSLTLREKFSEKMGFASFLVIKCSDCKFSHDFYTSNPVGKSYDINLRVIYAMRNIGQGHASIKKFTTLMNMPSPMTVKNYDLAVSKITKHVVNIAEQTMTEAVKEIKSLKETPADSIVDIPISCDGSWQRRGFASLNGSFTSISLDTGKIVDIQVMSRYCKGCKSKGPLQKTDKFAFDNWKQKHKCRMNHSGSAGAMEITGAKEIFSRSIEKHGLRYHQYLGDGDSKSYPAVKDIYKTIEVEKLECVGHIQKRVGNRLRNLKKNVKGLGGKGKLTNAVIDRLQNYYGIAIRANAGDLEAMKKAACAVMFHVASSAKCNYHTAYCPTGVNSWCRFQKDKAMGTSEYKPGCGLSLEIIKHLKPIFNDLSRETLLKKCLHGKTQNQNESFNSLIWERLPKSKYVSLTQLRFGTYDAVAHFNIGMRSSIMIYGQLEMKPGRYMVK